MEADSLKKESAFSVARGGSECVWRMCLFYQGRLGGNGGEGEDGMREGTD